MKRGPKPKPAVDRVMRQVAKGTPGSCWEWQGYRGGRYGMLGVQRPDGSWRMCPVHRRPGTRPIAPDGEKTMRKLAMLLALSLSGCMSPQEIRDMHDFFAGPGYGPSPVYYPMPIAPAQPNRPSGYLCLPIGADGRGTLCQ